MKMLKVKLFSCIIFCCAISISYSANESVSIEKSGFGSSIVLEEKISEAKKIALDKAIKQAFQSTILSLVPDSLLFAGFNEVVLLLESDPSFYIEEFQVTGEVLKDSEYLVSVKASFNKKTILEKLAKYGIVVEVVKFPKTMLLISQKEIEDFVAYRWWQKKEMAIFSNVETTISENLKGIGYEVVDPFILEKSSNDSFEMEEVLDKKEAINIALKKNADVVLVGKAAALPGGNKIDGKETIKVSLSIVAFKTDSGEEIYSFENNSIIAADLEAADTSKAFEKAGKVAGKEIGLEILSYWKKLSELTKEFELEISGTNYLPRFIMFKNKLKELNIVDDLIEKEITSNGSVVVAEFKGSIDELAKKLVEVPFENFGIELERAGENRMRINFISNE